MDIQILQLIEGAQKARGLTVIIDVFRAFTTACYLVANGARIIPVGEIETAYRLKKENPHYILLGERKGKIMPGFDYGNSPAHIEEVDFSGKTVIQTTSAGTQGIVKAAAAEEIIAGCFVNAQAVVNYIKDRSPAVVSLVCMGLEGLCVSEEDTLCAQYIRSSLRGEPFNLEGIPAVLKKGSGRRFFIPANQEWSPRRDFELCLRFNAFDFVLRVEKKGDLLFFEKVMAGLGGE